MQPSLFPQIEQVRRRLGRRRLATATCWALATAIVAVLALGGLDRALAIQDLPGRVLLSALSAGVVIAILSRWFRAITTRDMSALEVALSVERRYPELRDVVTSALDFSTQEADDPAAGSASLRRAVVLRAATAVEEVDWHQFVPLRPLQRAALACAGVLVVLASVAWWTPQAVGTGMVRLANPFSRPHEIVDPPAKLATTQAARPLAIEVPPDKAPQISFLEPTTEQLTLVPWATLPLVIEARDDLALESIELVVWRSDLSEQGDQVLPLWQGPDVGAPKRHRLEYLWQLAPLSLQTGSVVEVHARASDFRRTTGQTISPLQIAVVSEDDLLRELGEREAALLDVVERTLIQQRELHARTADWAEQPTWSPDRLANESHAVLFGQRQIANALVGAADSAARSVEFMLRDLSRNHLDRPEFSARLRALRGWLGELADGPLPQIDQSLGNLVRLSQRGDSPVAESELWPLVAATVNRQEQVIATLERAFDSLSAGNAMGRIERQLTALTGDQRQLAEHCHELFLDWLFDPSTVGDRELEPAAGGQRQLARRLAELTVRMATLSDKLADRQPQLAARLKDVTAMARELGLQMTMRSAAEQLAQRHFGRATSLQRQAAVDLLRLHDLLAEHATRLVTGESQQQSQCSGGESKQSFPPKPGASKPGTSPATGASPTTSQNGDLAASLETTRELVKDLWGHLPERQRQQILQPLSEDFLPKYATEIEEYFRALADPARRPPESP